MSVQQSAITVENPFQLTEAGILFRGKWGIKFTRPSQDIETVSAVLETLNKAFQQGFMEGVETGKNLK